MTANLKKKIKKVLSKKNLDKLAENTGFITRKRKINGYNFLYSLIFLLSPGSINLRSLQESIFLKGDISRQALSKKFNKKSSAFIKKVFYELLNIDLNIETNLISIFKDIKILDSTYFRFLNSMAKSFPHIGHKYVSGAKMQLFYSYMNGIFHVSFNKSRENDQSYTEKIIDLLNKGDLFLADKAYMVATLLFQLIEKEVYFIGRYNQRNLYIKTINKKNELIYKNVNFIKLLSNKNNDFIEKFYIRNNKNQYVELSIYCYKLSGDIVEKKRIKAINNAKRNNKSGKPTEKTLVLLNWEIFITNIEEGMIKENNIGYLYRIRWQIELLFKNYKSVMQLDKYIVKTNPERIKTEFYAKMIIFILSDKTFKIAQTKSKKELSFYKFFSLFSEYIPIMAIKINQSVSAFYKLIEKIIELGQKVSIISKQRNRNTTKEMITWL